MKYLIILFYILTQVSISSVEEDNNYPPPPDDRRQAPPPNENNYPPPSQSQKPSSNNKYTTTDKAGDPRDVKADSQNSHRYRGIDKTVGEREYTYSYRTYDSNYGYYYDYSDETTHSPLFWFIILILGLVIIYLSILIICHTESNQVSHINFINWLKQNSPQKNEEQYIPTHQLITIEGQLEVLKSNLSSSIVENPEILIQLKVMEERFEKIETTSKIGNKVRVSTKYVWSHPKDILTISNEIQFANHKLSPDAFNKFTSISDEFISLPTVNQINQFMKEQKLYTTFNNTKDGYYYTNHNLSQPMLNDKRIKIFYRKIDLNAQYSFLGSFNGLYFEPYITPIKKGNLNLLFCCFNVYNKSHSVCHCTKDKLNYQEYIQLEEKANMNSTITMRILGFVIYLIGNFLLMLPLYKLISLIPFIGPQLCYVGMSIGLIISVIGFLSIFVIAWFNARPQISIILGFILLIVSIIVSTKINTMIINEDTSGASISFKEAIYKSINFYFHK